ncbi:MAG TPA: hypothetical protein VMJ32_14660 [Pirellulales bacterium]|nr:hypothetical protein [Pirellulales bacterium]
MNMFLFASPMLLAQQPGIVKLMLIIGAVLLAVFVFKLCCFTIHLLFHPHGLGLFAVFIVLLLMLWGFVGVQSHSKVEQPGPVAVMNPPNIVVNPPNQVFIDNFRGPTIAANAQKTTPRDAAVSHPSENTNDPLAAADHPSEAESKATKNADSNSNTPPDWISQSPRRHGEDWIYVVHLDAADNNPAVRDEMLAAKMVLAADQVIDEQLYPGEGRSKIVNIDAEYLRAHCKGLTYPVSDTASMGKEFYVQLVFDKKFRDEVERRYSQIVGWDHLQQLGDMAAISLAMLGGVYIYLRMTAAKSAARMELEETAAKT